MNAFLTNTSCVMLRKTRWTFAREASKGVDTEELTIVLFGLTLIEIWKSEMLLS